MSESRGTKAPRWAWWVATGFGSGRLKPAPGTWGSLAALLVWCGAVGALILPLEAAALSHPDWSEGLQWAGEAVFLALPILAAWIGVKASDRIVRETGEKDPGYIVVDEWAGLWIALWALRWQIARDLGFLVTHFTQGGWRALPDLLVPFLLFRLFDIWKPWPTRQIQILPDGAGVMADDVVAGLYAIPAAMLLMPPVSQLLR